MRGARLFGEHSALHGVNTATAGMRMLGSWAGDIFCAAASWAERERKQTLKDCAN